MKLSHIRSWMNYPSSQCHFLSASTILLTVRQECSLHCGWALWPQLFPKLQYKDLKYPKSSTATTCSFGLSADSLQALELFATPMNDVVLQNAAGQNMSDWACRTAAKGFGLFWLIFVYSCWSTDIDIAQESYVAILVNISSIAEITAFRCF